MTIRALSCAVLIAWCCGFERHAEAQVIHTPNDHVPNFAASPIRGRKCSAASCSLAASAAA